MDCLHSEPDTAHAHDPVRGALSARNAPLAQLALAGAFLGGHRPAPRRSTVDQRGGPSHGDAEAARYRRHAGDQSGGGPSHGDADGDPGGHTSAG